MVGDFIISLFAGMLGGSIARQGIRRGWARQASQGLFLCGLRVVSGTQPGLTGEWRIGDWNISPDRMRLENVEITVVGTVSGSDRPALPDESLGGGEDTIIVAISTASAELEWSMLTRFEGLARRALGVQGGERSPI